MIQFNLLPDVKLEFLKARYRRRLVTAISVVCSAVCLTIFIALFAAVRVGQTSHLKNLDSDVQERVGKLQGKSDLNKILTIQNQLNSLPALHDKKVVSSRLFDYLSQLVPVEADISNMSVDFVGNQILISGSADSIITVNKFVDTLKFTNYTVPKKDPDKNKLTKCLLEASKSVTVVGAPEPKETDPVPCKAFNGVVLTNFSLTNAATAVGEKSVSYEVKFAFDPVIFAIIKDPEPLDFAKPVQLLIPSIISTRSETEKPLFSPAPVPDNRNDSGLGR